MYEPHFQLPTNHRLHTSPHSLWSLVYVVTVFDGAIFMIRLQNKPPFSTVQSDLVCYASSRTSRLLPQTLNSTSGVNWWGWVVACLCIVWVLYLFFCSIYLSSCGLTSTFSSHHFTCALTFWCSLNLPKWQPNGSPRYLRVKTHINNLFLLIMSYILVPWNACVCLLLLAVQPKRIEMKA